jgi:uncharacterized membrane protein YcaP (DUF421 family)
MLTQLLDSLIRVALVAPAAYIALIVLLRISGKRTLSQFNAFDFVVTVAIGSMLATIVVSRDVQLPVGIIGFALLILLQFVVAWLVCRIPRVECAVKARPSLLLQNGEFLNETMLDERVSEEEILMAIRKTGNGDLADIAAVVLETDGSFSVIPRERLGNASALPSGWPAGVRPPSAR